MRNNRDKDAIEIMANIEQREAKREPQLMEEFMAGKFADRNKDQLNKFDIDKQRDRIKYLFGRVKMKNRLEKDFAQKNYFQYVKSSESTDPSSIRDMNKAKLKGKFKVEMKKNFSPVQKI